MPPKKRTAKKLSLSAPKKTPKAKAALFSKAAKKRGFSLRSLHLGAQFTIAGSAFLVLLFLASITRGTFATRLSEAAGTEPVAIGLEHEGPAALGILVARKDATGLMSLQNRTTVAMHISMPASWKRIEVSGASLDDVVSEIPVFGFKRWTLPAGATISMLIESVPPSILFDNASLSVASVEITSVDIKSEEVIHTVSLVQGQTLVGLWTDQE